MPYADNLYSADDSENESFSDELSPSDGYFTVRDHPQEVMVPDPSLPNISSIAESKAHEASQEASTHANSHIPPSAGSPIPGVTSPSYMTLSASSNPYAAPSSTSRSSHAPLSPTFSHRRQDTLYTESSSLLHHAQAPPAYSAANSNSGPAEPVSTFGHNYNTISQHEPESGETFHRETENMTFPDYYHERTPLWRKQATKLSPWRNFMKSCLLIALVLSIAILLTLAVANSDIWGEHNANRPVIDPGQHGPYCNRAKIRRHDLPMFEFKSGDGLAILQVDQQSDPNNRARNTQITGKVILRRLPEDSKEPHTGLITLEIWVSHANLKVNLEMDDNSQALKIGIPLYMGNNEPRNSCLSLEVTVWLPVGVSFKNLQVLTYGLDIEVIDDADYYSDTSSFESSSGSISFPAVNELDPSIKRFGNHISNSLAMASSWHHTPPEPPAVILTDKIPEIRQLSAISSPEILVETRSGSIRGTFPLYNLLSLSSQSGSVNVVIFPQPATEGSLEVAKLLISTTSGGVHAREPIRVPSLIPDRQYVSKVTSNSGSINGMFVLGSEATFKSTSGGINLVLLPDKPEQAAVLNTESSSGSSRIVVLSPITRDPKPGSADYELTVPSSQQSLRIMTSSHVSTSGGIKLHYPSEWEGQVNAQSISGGISMTGDGLTIIKDSQKNWAWKEQISRKGPDATHASQVQITTRSGSQRGYFGEGCVNDEWCK